VYRRETEQDGHECRCFCADAAPLQHSEFKLSINVISIQNLTLINNHEQTNTPDHNKPTGVMC